MPYDIGQMAYDIAKREALAVDKWMAEMGVTVETVTDYTLTVHHAPGGGTEYGLYRGGYPKGTLLGKLRVTYTATDVAFATGAN
jgi:hypothetical protein